MIHTHRILGKTLMNGDSVLVESLDFFENANIIEVQLSANGTGMLSLVDCSNPERDVELASLAFADDAFPAPARIIGADISPLHGHRNVLLHCSTDAAATVVKIEGIGCRRRPGSDDAFRTISAVDFTSSKDCRRESFEDPCLGYVSDGAWILFEDIDFGMGASFFQARAATPMSGGYIEIHIEDPEGGTEMIAGICRVVSTGSWEDWTYVNCPIRPVSGKKRVKLVFRRDQDDYLFNLHSFSFSASAAGLYRETATKFFAADADSMSSNIIILKSEDSDGAMAIGAIRNGDGIAFARVNLHDNTNYFEARVATPFNGGSIEIHLIDMERNQNTLVGTLTVPATGSWTGWKTIGCPIQSVRGRKILELVFRNPRHEHALNLTWFRFSVVQRTGLTNILNASERVLAQDFSGRLGIVRERTEEDGGHHLAYIHDGSFVTYDAVDFGQGLGCFEANVATEFHGGVIELYVDDIKIGNLGVGSTGNWQKWASFSTPLDRNVSGIHRLRLVFAGGAGFLFNLRWFQFHPAPRGAHV